MSRDRGIGIFTIILALAAGYMTMQLPASRVAGDVGPAIFPYISEGILLITGLILTFRKPVKAKPFLENKGEVIRFLSIIGVIVVYVFLLWAIGFVIPTFLVLFVMCLMFGKKEGVKIWQAALYAAIVTFIIYAAFTWMLHLRLPKASLF